MTRGPARPRRAAGGAALGALAVLAACARPAEPPVPLAHYLSGRAWDPEPIAASPVPEDPFLAELRAGYLALAEDDLETRNWRTAAGFLARASLASRGEAAVPVEIGAMDEPEVGLAYQEIVTLRSDPGARRRARAPLGRAQVAYDCWAQRRLDGRLAAPCDARFAAAAAEVREAAALPKTFVVVLPGEAGPIGGVALAGAAGEVLLDRPNAAAGMSGAGPAPLDIDPAEIDGTFGAALAARPAPPRSFTFLYDFGRVALSDEEAAALEAVFADIAARAAPEVIVTGHADRPGGSDANLALSRGRAERVARAIRDGLPPGQRVPIEVRARGASEPEVEASGSEPRNRRVTVLVR